MKAEQIVWVLMPRSIFRDEHVWRKGIAGEYRDE